MRVKTVYNNFARGMLDHDMNGRFDLPIYRSGADLIENFYTNFKGNAIYRNGFVDMLGAFQDCVLYEFKFSDNQNYLMVFYNTKIRFASYDSNGDFGWVTSSGSPIEVTTTYTLDQCRDLQFTQNDDVIVITNQAHPPKDLTRTSSNSFTFANHTFTTSSPFTAPNYPKACKFHKNRLYLANTPNQPTTIWASEQGDYENFIIPGSPTATSPITVTIADISQPIGWLQSGSNSLLAGCSQGIVAINGANVGDKITAESIEADVTSTDGSSDVEPFAKDSLIFYLGKNSRNVYYFNYDLLTESFVAPDANLVSYEITVNGIQKMRHKKDKNDLIWCVRGDGKLISLNFKSSENIIAWHVHSTEGLFKDVAVISDNNGDPQLFVLVQRGSDFYIESLAPEVEFDKRVDFFTDDEDADDEAYNRKVAEQLKQCVYLDNSLSVNDFQEANEITYDAGAGTITAASSVFSSGDVGKQISYKTLTGYESGRFEITGYTSGTVVDVDVLQEPTSLTYENWYLTFSSISGLSQFNGTTVSLVADGAYLDDYDVSGGEVDIGRQVENVVIGYKYKGIIKSFCLGFQAGSENTQTTMKAITRVGMRFTTSSGGMFGSTLYRMEPVQERTQNDLNYLPPLPIDGTKEIGLSDDNEIDKYFYIVQQEPLPLKVTAVALDANYANTR
jgi:hypothetical protein